MRDLDKTVRNKTVDFDRRQTAMLEERLLSCQRDIEAQSQAQLEQQVFKCLIRSLILNNSNWPE